MPGVDSPHPFRISAVIQPTFPGRKEWNAFPVPAGRSRVFPELGVPSQAVTLSIQAQSTFQEGKG